MDWFHLLDEAEKRLEKVLPKRHAQFLVYVADSHEPWFSESKNVSGKFFSDRDIDRLVIWLLERKDQQDFNPYK